MQFAFLVYESPEAWATRNNDLSSPYVGAWRAYHKALVDAGVYSPAIRWKCRKQELQYESTTESGACRTARTLTPRSSWRDSSFWSSSLDVALDWAARCPTASAGAVEVRPLAPESKRRITE
jgi:hypothetical protein